MALQTCFHFFERILESHCMVFLHNFPDPRALLNHIKKIVLGDFKYIGFLRRLDRRGPGLASKKRNLSEKITRLEHGKLHFLSMDGGINPDSSPGENKN